MNDMKNETFSAIIHHSHTHFTISVLYVTICSINIVALQVDLVTPNIAEAVQTTPSQAQYLFQHNTYLRNKKHLLTCQGGNWLL